jgi:hypothetical protein
MYIIITMLRNPIHSLIINYVPKSICIQQKDKNVNIPVTKGTGTFRPDYLFAPGRFAPGRIAPGRFGPESESIRPT